MVDRRIRKDTRSDLEALLLQQEVNIRQALKAFLNETISDHMIADVISLLNNGDVKSILKLVDEHVARLGNVIPRVFSNAASAEVETLSAKLPEPKISITFDPTNERAATVMRQSKLKFIQQFSQTQRATTRTALTTALENGVGTRAAAKAFRDSIGLTSNQMDAVDNYRSMLERGSVEALDRVLRDRRFDSTVQEVADGGDPLTADQIDLMVDRYHSRMLDMRAETISRTESLTAMSQARDEATRQVMDDVGLDADQVERTWVATQDKRTRDSHAEMDGQVVTGMDEPFVTPDGEELMYPGDENASPEERINCRCTVTIRILHGDNVASTETSDRVLEEA